MQLKPKVAVQYCLWTLNTKSEINVHLNMAWTLKPDAADVSGFLWPLILPFRHSALTQHNCIDPSENEVLSPPITIKYK